MTLYLVGCFFLLHFFSRSGSDPVEWTLPLHELRAAKWTLSYNSTRTCSSTFGEVRTLFILTAKAFDPNDQQASNTKTRPRAYPRGSRSRYKLVRADSPAKLGLDYPGILGAELEITNAVDVVIDIKGSTFSRKMRSIG